MCKAERQGGIIGRGQGWEVGRPFKPARMTLGHFVNLSESHLAYQANGKTTCTACMAGFCMEMHVKMLL